MAVLTIAANLARPDDVYQLLVEGYEGLSADEVATFHASLALIALNHIGDAEVAQDAVAAARRAARARRTR